MEKFTRLLFTFGALIAMICILAAGISAFGQDAKTPPDKAADTSIVLKPLEKAEAEKRILFIENARLRVQLAQTELQSAEEAGNRFVLELFRAYNVSPDTHQFDSKEMRISKR